MLFGRRAKPSQPQSKVALDQVTPDHLAKAGGNLSLPTDIVNYLYLAREADARTAGADLASAGYQIDVRRAAAGPTWLVLARIDMVPSAQNIRLVRERFEGLAARFGGEYDGWEAAVTK